MSEQWEIFLFLFYPNGIQVSSPEYKCVCESDGCQLLSLHVSTYVSYLISFPHFTSQIRQSAAVMLRMRVKKHWKKISPNDRERFAHNFSVRTFQLLPNYTQLLQLKVSKKWAVTVMSSLLIQPQGGGVAGLHAGIRVSYTMQWSVCFILCVLKYINTDKDTQVIEMSHKAYSIPILLAVCSYTYLWNVMNE